MLSLPNETQLPERFTRFKKLNDDRRQEFAKWVGYNDKLAEATLQACDDKGQWFYEDLPKEINIQSLKPEAWELIQTITLLKEKWKEISQDKTLKGFVRQLAAKPYIQPAKWSEAQRVKLKALEVLYERQDNGYDLIPLFAAYVYYTSPQSWQKRLIESGRERWLYFIVRKIKKNFKAWWERLNFTPEGLIFMAILSLVGAFFTFTLPSWLPISLIALYVILRVEGSFWLKTYAFCSVLPVILKLLTDSFPWLNFLLDILTAWLQNSLIWPLDFLVRPIFMWYIPFLVLFISFFVLINDQTPQQRLKAFIITFVASVTLFQQFIGLPTKFIAYVNVILFISMLAIHKLYEAKGHLKESRKIPPYIKEFLIKATDRQAYINRSKWSWPNGILFSILSLLGLLLFFSLFSSSHEQVSCVIAGVNENIEANILYPVWLSDRDQASLYITLTNQSRQPSHGSGIYPVALAQTPSLFLEPNEAMHCNPTCSWDLPASSHFTMSWNINTLSPIEGEQLGQWALRVDKLEAKVDKQKTKSSEACMLTISRLKVPFGVRGFLENQPLITIVAFLYGIGQAFFQIWIGEKVFGVESKAETPEV